MKNNTIEKFLNTLYGNTYNTPSVREVRVLGTNRRGYTENYFGYFDHPAKVIPELEKYNFQGNGSNYQIYITLNPCNPDCLARSKNKFKNFDKRAKATSDNEIDNLQFLLVDCDPVRISGVSATASELEKARELAETIKKELGEPAICAMSGNGYHLIYKHNAKNKQQIKVFLNTLADKHENEFAKVDRSVFNPARITKLIGTIAKKGDNTEDRPHRRSELIETNRRFSITLDIPPLPDSPPKTTKPLSPTFSTSVDNVALVRSFLCRHGFAYKEKNINGAIFFCLGNCGFDPSHTNNESAVVVQHFGLITYQCFHSSCQGRTWAELREKYDGPKQPKTKPCNKCGKDIVWNEGQYCNPKTGKTHRCKPEKKKKSQITTNEYFQFFTEKGWNFRLNEILDDIYIGKERLTDEKMAMVKNHCRDWCISNNSRIDIGHIVDSVSDIAGKNHFHPVRDYLNSLPNWDGADRIKQLALYFKHDGNFARWLEIWLAGAVRRAMTGKHHPMLALRGGQGIGKSFFSKWLCPLDEFYNDSGIHPDQKDSRLKILTSWIWEVGEIGASTRRSDIDAIKAFLSLETIRDRKPYGRHEIVKPALASFIGTVNGDFLVDKTGNRRFLTVGIESIDWGYTENIDKGQLWAQAVCACKKQRYILTPDEKIKKNLSNEENMITDPIEIFIEELFSFSCAGDDFISTSEILNLLSEKKINPTRSTAMVVSEIMKKYGAKKGIKRINGKQQRGFTGIKKKSPWSS